MRVLNKKLWIGLPILVAVAVVIGAIVMRGIEGAFISLGALVLIGMVSFSIYTLKKALHYTNLLLKGQRWNNRGTPIVSLFSGNLTDAFYSEPARVGLITRKDKRAIMKHIDELFVRVREQSQEEPATVEPINEEDRKIIMEHIGELFAIGRERSEETSF